MSSVVEQLYRNFVELDAVLTAAAEPSLAVTANDCFRKALLLAAASEFEMRITQAIVEYSELKCGAGSPFVAFVQNKALKRQYHTLFAWEKGNANLFFGLFGPEFKAYAESAIKSDPALRTGVEAFLELGDDRNRLVHQNFGSFALEKTADDIFARVVQANVFVDRLPAMFASYPIALTTQVGE